MIKSISPETFCHWNINMTGKLNFFHYTGLQGFVVEKLWVVSGVIFDVESESRIRISRSRQNFEIFEVMWSKNGVFRYFWGYVQGARNFFGLFLRWRNLSKFTDYQNPQAQIFKINFRMQNGMHQRVNVDAHKVVRINVKTWYGRIFVKKNLSWLFNSSFWRERVVLNDDIWEKNQKIFCALYITSKVAKNPIFRAHNLKYLKILTW